MDPYITVVVPNYNGSAHIEECLNSIINQTVRNIEVIVADDASSDSSVEIVERFVESHPNIRLVVGEENVGLAANKARAAHLARGTYVTTLDSDDYYISKDKLKTELAVLQHYESIGVENVAAYSRTVTVNEDGQVLRIGGFQCPPQGWILSDLISFSMSFEPRDFLVRRQYFLHEGGIDTRTQLYVDWVHKLKIAKVCLFVCSDIEGTAYRQHSGARMSSQSAWRHISALNYGFINHASSLPARTRLRARLKLYRHFARLAFRSVAPTFLSK